MPKKTDDDHYHAVDLTNDLLLRYRANAAGPRSKQDNYLTFTRLVQRELYVAYMESKDYHEVLDRIIESLHTRSQTYSPGMMAGLVRFIITRASRDPTLMADDEREHWNFVTKSPGLNPGGVQRGIDALSVRVRHHVDNGNVFVECYIPSDRIHVLKASSPSLLFNGEEQAFIYNAIEFAGLSPEDTVTTYVNWVERFQLRLRKPNNQFQRAMNVQVLNILGLFRHIKHQKGTTSSSTVETEHWRRVTEQSNDLLAEIEMYAPAGNLRQPAAPGYPGQPLPPQNPPSGYLDAPQPVAHGYRGQYSPVDNPSSGYQNVQHPAGSGYAGQSLPPQNPSSGFSDLPQGVVHGYPGQYSPRPNPPSGFSNPPQLAASGYPGQYSSRQNPPSGLLYPPQPAVHGHSGQYSVREDPSSGYQNVRQPSPTRKSRPPADPVKMARMEETLGLPRREDSDYPQGAAPSRTQRHSPRGSYLGEAARSPGSGRSASPARELSSEERLENARQRTPQRYRRDRLTPEQLRSMSEEAKDAEVKLAEWEQKQWAPLLARAGDRLLFPEYEAEIAEIWDRIQRERRNHENKFSAKRQEQAKSGRRTQGHLDDRNMPRRQGQQLGEEERQRRSGGGGHEPSKKDKRPPNYPQEPKKRGDGRRR